MAARAPAWRAWARVLVACAVLAGLFLMHGLPTPSCAAPAGGPAPSMTAATMAGHRSRPAVASVGPSVGASLASSTAGASGSAIVSSTDPGDAGAGMAGGMCVSTPPPASGLAALLALLLLAVGVVVGGDRVGPPIPAGRLRRGGGRRAPPLAGAGLLVSLCISRT